MAADLVLYPSWRYHATHPARIVRSPDEDTALGAEWASSPALLGRPVASPPSEPVTPVANDPRASELWAAQVSTVVARVREATDAVTLADVRAMEVLNPKVKGGRRTVMQAIDARLEALARDAAVQQ